MAYGKNAKTRRAIEAEVIGWRPLPSLPASRSRESPDGLLCRGGLPDIDGREAARILRRNGFKAPMIMLTGHNTDSDIILGLESGANDYVTKPFRFAVLLARVRTLLRQYETSEDAVHHPDRFRDQRGVKMWDNVMALIGRRQAAAKAA
jgi:DNA-binding response OmpR family regulator